MRKHAPGKRIIWLSCAAQSGLSTQWHFSQRQEGGSRSGKAQRRKKSSFWWGQNLEQNQNLEHSVEVLELLKSINFTVLAVLKAIKWRMDRLAFEMCQQKLSGQFYVGVFGGPGFFWSADVCSALQTNFFVCQVFGRLFLSSWTVSFCAVSFLSPKRNGWEFIDGFSLYSAAMLRPRWFDHRGREGDLHTHSHCCPRGNPAELEWLRQEDDQLPYRLAYQGAQVEELHPGDDWSFQVTFENMWFSTWLNHPNEWYTALMDYGIHSGLSQLQYPRRCWIFVQDLGAAGVQPDLSTCSDAGLKPVNMCEMCLCLFGIFDPLFEAGNQLPVQNLQFCQPNNCRKAAAGKSSAQSEVAAASQPMSTVTTSQPMSTVTTSPMSTVTTSPMSTVTTSQPMSTVTTSQPMSTVTTSQPMSTDRHEADKQAHANQMEHPKLPVEACNLSEISSATMSKFVLGMQPSEVKPRWLQLGTLRSCCSEDRCQNSGGDVFLAFLDGKEAPQALMQPVVHDFGNGSYALLVPEDTLLPSGPYSLSIYLHEALNRSVYLEGSTTQVVPLADPQGQQDLLDGFDLQQSGSDFQGDLRAIYLQPESALVPTSEVRCWKSTSERKGLIPGWISIFKRTANGTGVWS